ncbi:MAG: EpsG family protein, partial [Paludibacteraceae bacterium]|nr:EpsG family protein [Paludibacteraceae bacterium]
MFYLMCFFILLVLAVLNIQMHDKLSTQILTGLAAIMLICIAGLRYETGGDWDTYTMLFNHFPTFSQLIGRPAVFADVPVEEGFVLLSAFIKSLGGTVQHLFFVVTFINITLIACAARKYTQYPVVALLCYYGILYFNLEMIYIRQAMAVALCFFALQYIEPRRIVPYLVFILLACTFHRVAALMIPLYFFMHRRIPSWVYLTAVGVGAVLMLAGIPWIQTIFLTVAGWLGENYANKAETYTENAMFAVNRGLSIGFVLNLAMLGVLMLFKKKIDERP